MPAYERDRRDFTRRVDDNVQNDSTTYSNSFRKWRNRGLDFLSKVTAGDVRFDALRQVLSSTDDSKCKEQPEGSLPHGREL